MVTHRDASGNTMIFVMVSESYPTYHNRSRRRFRHGRQRELRAQPYEIIIPWESLPIRRLWCHQLLKNRSRVGREIWWWNSWRELRMWFQGLTTNVNFTLYLPLDGFDFLIWWIHDVRLGASEGVMRLLLCDYSKFSLCSISKTAWTPITR